MSISQIARVLGISRNTVRAAVASDGPPKYERKPAGSIVDPVEPRIRELLKAYPSMPATVIAERIGWTRSIRVLSGRVAEAVCASPAGPHTDRDLVQVIRDRHPGKHGQWGLLYGTARRTHVRSDSGVTLPSRAAFILPHPRQSRRVAGSVAGSTYVGTTRLGPAALPGAEQRA